MTPTRGVTTLCECTGNVVTPLVGVMCRGVMCRGVMCRGVMCRGVMHAPRLHVLDRL